MPLAYTVLQKTNSLICTVYAISGCGKLIPNDQNQLIMRIGVSTEFSIEIWVLVTVRQWFLDGKIPHNPVVSGITLPPTHSPLSRVFMCRTPQGIDALATLSGQASSFSLSERSVSPTNLLWLLLLPLFLCLRALLPCVQGKTECPCQESGTLSYSRAGSSHCVQYANQHFCASVLSGFLMGVVFFTIYMVAQHLHILFFLFFVLCTKYQLVINS